MLTRRPTPHRDDPRCALLVQVYREALSAGAREVDAMRAVVDALTAGIQQPTAGDRDSNRAMDVVIRQVADETDVPARLIVMGGPGAVAAARRLVWYRLRNQEPRIGLRVIARRFGVTPAAVVNGARRHREAVESGAGVAGERDGARRAA
jgi:hypothetical protein